jgi:hypothetical protein
MSNKTEQSKFRWFDAPPCATVDDEGNHCPNRPTIEIVVDWGDRFSGFHSYMHVCNPCYEAWRAGRVKNRERYTEMELTSSDKTFRMLSKALHKETQRILKKHHVKIV